MKKILLIALVTGFLMVLKIGSVGATLFVDFRDWEGAHGETSWTQDGVTATALPEGKKLYQDNTDGLGILGGEPDEIDGNEKLFVSFGNGLMLTGAWITDLFDSPDGGNDTVGEWGRLLLNSGTGTDTFDFYGRDANQGNGEFYVDFQDDLWAYTAEFITMGDWSNNEFSVAGFTGHSPEPATLVLLGIGIGGIVLFRRNTQRKKN